MIDLTFAAFKQTDAFKTVENKGHTEQTLCHMQWQIGMLNQGLTNTATELYQMIDEAKGNAPYKGKYAELFALHIHPLKPGEECIIKIEDPTEIRSAQNAVSNYSKHVSIPYRTAVMGKSLCVERRKFGGDDG